MFFTVASALLFAYLVFYGVLKILLYAYLGFYGVLSALLSPPVFRCSERLAVRIPRGLQCFERLAVRIPRVLRCSERTPANQAASQPSSQSANQGRAQPFGFYPFARCYPSCIHRCTLWFIRMRSQMTIDITPNYPQTKSSWPHSDPYMNPK
jgi:hypothetical protein